MVAWRLARRHGARAWRCVSGEAQRLEEHWRLFSRCQTASAPVESLEALSTELHGLVQRTQPTAEQEAAKDALLRQVQQAGQESLDGCQAELFGSAATKQWMPGSDLDICLLAPGMTAKASQVRGLRKVASALRQLGGGTHNIQPRFHAQMPILRWAPRRPDRAGALACDISVGNVLAVANTRLIATYLEIDQRVPVLLRAIKVWAKKRGINNRQRGSFSSFALTLMLIHVLQARPSPLLPSLQDLAIQHELPPLFLQGADCRYCSDSELISGALLKLQGDHGTNQECVGALLLEFFRYFGWVYQCGRLRSATRRPLHRSLRRASPSMSWTTPSNRGKTSPTSRYDSSLAYGKSSAGLTHCFARANRLTHCVKSHHSQARTRWLG